MTKWIVAALVMLPAVSFAEGPADIAPGTFELGGDTGLSYFTGSSKIKYDAAGAQELEMDQTLMNVDATAIYYVAPKLGVGLSATYEKETSEFDGDESTSSTLLIGPGVALHLPVAPQVALFGRGMIGYASGKMTESGEPDMDASGYGLALQAGLKYFVMEQASLNFGVEYDFLKMTTDSQSTSFGTIPELETTTSGVGLNVGLSVYFGR